MNDPIYYVYISMTTEINSKYRLTSSIVNTLLTLAKSRGSVMAGN